MKIILSPAKKMNNGEPCGSFGQSVFEISRDTDVISKAQLIEDTGVITKPQLIEDTGVITKSQLIEDTGVITKPQFMDRTEEILAWLKSKNYEELKSLWKCNDKIAEQNVDRLEHMDLYTCLTPAVLSYEGIAYQYMAPAVFETGQYTYVQEHLRILSAFYGALRPMDGVTPYRLEMGAKASIGGTKNLYEFWGDRLYEAVHDESAIIINLASKEYSKCVEKYLISSDRYITISFVEMAKGKLVTKGTYAKMARGEMVRFMAENQIEVPEEIRKFDRLGYVFRDDLSSETEYVFERITDKTED